MDIFLSFSEGRKKKIIISVFFFIKFKNHWYLIFFEYRWRRQCCGLCHMTDDAIYMVIYIFY